MKKLDKTDIVVLLLCAAGVWYAFTRPTPSPKTTPPAAPAETAKTSDAAKPVVEGPAADKPAQPRGDATTPPVVAEETFTLANPAVEYVFTTLGGGIKTARVLEAPFAGKTAQELNSFGEGAIGALARGAGEIDRAVWTVKEKSDRSVTFELTTKDRLAITKKWSMVDGEEPKKGPGYLWNLEITIKNAAAETFTGDDFYLYTGASNQLHNGDGLYVRSGYLADGRSHEIKPDQFDESRRLWVLWKTREQQEVIKEEFGKLTWGGVHSQYYTTLINPQTEEAGRFWTKKFRIGFTDDSDKVNGFALHAGVGLPQVKLDAGAEQKLSYQVFTGPRSATLLDKSAQSRGEAMFYGMTGVLSRLFLWMLNGFHGWTASFGVAIILLTIVVRIAIWPLHIKATRSMKRMALLSPLMNEVKAKYKDKPQTPDLQRKMQMETMGLMREYNVSPLGGCLPLLLQMPIFFGYFGMLNHAVEMRGHSFLWARDLTLPDTILRLWGFPLNPLPLLMTATMYLQMKLTPTPQNSDPNAQLQMKIFKFMPLMFLLFCYTYASALALYWTIQNIISMAQTQALKLFPEPQLEKRQPRKMAPISGAGGAEAEKPKGPKPPRAGGGKSAFKKRD